MTIKDICNTFSSAINTLHATETYTHTRVRARAHKYTNSLYKYGIRVLFRMLINLCDDSTNFSVHMVFEYGRKLAQKHRRYNQYNSMNSSVCNVTHIRRLYPTLDDGIISVSAHDLLTSSFCFRSSE